MFRNTIIAILTTNFQKKRQNILAMKKCITMLKHMLISINCLKIFYSIQLLYHLKVKQLSFKCLLSFNRLLLEYVGDQTPVFSNIQKYDRLWRLVCKDIETNEKSTYVTPFVCIASGHHSIPKIPKFKGEESFKGEIFHSVKYKSATFNNLTGKRVLVVGIGNSGVDIATNLVNEGRCPKVSISTRSGAWYKYMYLQTVLCCSIYDAFKG